MIVASCVRSAAVPTGEELVRVLADLQDATADARIERANLREAIKDARRLLPEAVAAETAKLVGVLADETRDAMHTAVGDAVGRLERDLRSRLGL